MKKLAIFATAFGLFLFSSSIVFAQEIHSPHIGTSSQCPAVWHFVHNQIEGAEQGTLTAEFQNAGTRTVLANKVLSTVQHYDVVLNSPDTLTNAHDSIPGGKLVLSHVSCTETPSTTTTTTTTIPSTTTTTTVPPTTTTTTTTTTTIPPTTTTTTTTTTLPPTTTTTTTTTTIPSTTTTTVPPTTTTTIPSTTTTTTVPSTTTTIAPACTCTCIPLCTLGNTTVHPINLTLHVFPHIAAPNWILLFIFGILMMGLGLGLGFLASRKKVV